MSVKEILPEPWLRGAMPGVPPLVMPVFFSFAQVREDVKNHAADLTKDQVWRPVGRNSVGFQLQHIAGSLDRLTTYLAGSQLSPAQLAFLDREQESGADPRTLLEQLERALRAAEESLLGIGDIDMFELRTVGRQALPTTVLGLLVHLAEHTQRHLGQLITIAQFVRQSAAAPPSR